MIDWTKSHIERLGGSATWVENPDGTKDRPLPPILCGSFIADPKKKTVCVYGHLDVQPAAKEDGWATDPFVLTEKDGKLYGRGSTDDKGPALSWLWVIEAHQELGIELPVNVKLLYEGLEESGSEGIFEVIRNEAGAGRFLDDVDFFCISDNVSQAKVCPRCKSDECIDLVLARKGQALSYLWFKRTSLLQIVSAGLRARFAFWCLGRYCS